MDHHLVQTNRMNVAKFLFESGAILKEKNDDGETASELAKRLGRVEIHKFLSENEFNECLIGCGLQILFHSHSLTTSP